MCTGGLAAMGVFTAMCIAKWQDAQTIASVLTGLLAVVFLVGAMRALGCAFGAGSIETMTSIVESLDGRKIVERRLSRDELIELATKIKEFDSWEQEEAAFYRMCELFDRNVPHPEGSKLIFFREGDEDLDPSYDATPEEAVQIALSYDEASEEAEGVKRASFFTPIIALLLVGTLGCVAFLLGRADRFFWPQFVGSRGLLYCVLFWSLGGYGAMVAIDKSTIPSSRHLWTYIYVWPLVIVLTFLGVFAFGEIDGFVLAILAVVAAFGSFFGLWVVSAFLVTKLRAPNALPPDQMSGPRSLT